MFRGQKSSGIVDTAAHAQSPGSCSSLRDRSAHALFPHRLRRPVWSLAAVGICLLLTGRPGFADDPNPSVVQTGAGAQEDQQGEALLLKVEQQINAGHFIWPQDDNALRTWELFQKSAVPAAPRTRRALTDFMGRMTSRAGEEQQAGHPEISRVLTSFGAMANAMLSAPAPPSITNSPPAKAPPATASNSASTATTAPPAPASDSARTATTPPPEQPVQATSASTPSKPAPALAAAIPADGSAGKAETKAPGPATTPRNVPPVASAAEANAGKPPPAAPANAAPTLATPVAPPAAQPANPQQQALAAIYISRGDEMLAVRDISAARKFYEYAANVGSAAAAMALARTFDPASLAELGVVGLRPDPARAAVWYRKAAVLGAPDAKARLQMLGAIDVK